MDIFAIRMLHNCRVELAEVDLSDWPWHTTGPYKFPEFGPNYNAIIHLKNIIGVVKARTIVRLVRRLLVKSAQLLDQLNDKEVHKLVCFLLDENQPDHVLQYYLLIGLFSYFISAFHDDDYAGIAVMNCANFLDSEREQSMIFDRKALIDLAYYFGMMHQDYTINKVTDGGKFTILTHFCKGGTARCIKLLIKAGEDVNMREPCSQMTPLMLAAHSGDYAMVRLLLDAGADPSARDDVKMPTFWPAFTSSEEITLELLLDKLIEKEPDVDLTEGIRLYPWEIAFVKNKERPNQKENFLTIARWRRYRDGFIRYNKIGFQPVMEVLISRRNTDKSCLEFLSLLAQRMDWQMVRLFLRVLMRQNLPDANQIYTTCFGEVLKVTRHPCVLHQFELAAKRKLILSNPAPKTSHLVPNKHPRDTLSSIVDIGLKIFFLAYMSENEITDLFLQDHKGVLLFYKVMKHPCFWKHIYPTCIKNGVLDEAGELLNQAYRFAKWYHNVPRNDTAYFPISGPNNPWNRGGKPSIPSLMQKEYIVGLLREDPLKEEQQIRGCLVKLLKDISRQIEETHEEYSFEPYLTGSSAEGTKAGYPDEYDFLLIMHNQKELQRCHFQVPNHTMALIATQPDGESFDVEYLLHEFTDLMKDKLLYYDYPEQLSLTKSISESWTGIKPANLCLNWYGSIFPDLAISVDVTPAFEIPKSSQFEKLRCLHKPKYCITKSLGFSQSDLRLTFSVNELNIIETLPEHVKCGYQLAKAMRHKEICPPMQRTDGCCADCMGYISSYMLKTCLFYVTHAESYKSIPSWSRKDGIMQPESVLYAKKIYLKLKAFLEHKNGKIPNYFVPSANVCSSLQIDCKGGFLEEQLSQQKTKIRLHYVNLILDLLIEYPRPELVYHRLV